MGGARDGTALARLRLFGLIRNRQAFAAARVSHASPLRPPVRGCSRDRIGGYRRLLASGRLNDASIQDRRDRNGNTRKDRRWRRAEPTPEEGSRTRPRRADIKRWSAFAPQVFLLRQDKCKGMNSPSGTVAGLMCRKYRQGSPVTSSGIGNSLLKR